ncbi:MAG: hypothetical protein RL518_1536 [Pseudomonadota bacterium]|jgi:hypothetical protein
MHGTGDGHHVKRLVRWILVQVERYLYEYGASEHSPAKKTPTVCSTVGAKSIEGTLC